MGQTILHLIVYDLSEAFRTAFESLIKSKGHEVVEQTIFRAPKSVQQYRITPTLSQLKDARPKLLKPCAFDADPSMIVHVSVMGPPDPENPTQLKPVVDLCNPRAIVSPGNSFGSFEGGFDLAISNYYADVINEAQPEKPPIKAHDFAREFRQYYNSVSVGYMPPMSARHFRSFKFLKGLVDNDTLENLTLTMYEKRFECDADVSVMDERYSEFNGYPAYGFKYEKYDGSNLHEFYPDVSQVEAIIQNRRRQYHLRRVPDIIHVPTMPFPHELPKYSEKTPLSKSVVFNCVWSMMECIKDRINTTDDATVYPICFTDDKPIKELEPHSFNYYFGGIFDLVDKDKNEDEDEEKVEYSNPEYRVLLPGLGTGVGKVPPTIAALHIYKAIELYAKVSKLKAINADKFCSLTSKSEEKVKESELEVSQNIQDFLAQNLAEGADWTNYHDPSESEGSERPNSNK